jgi:hypothetical protein
MLRLIGARQVLAIVLIDRAQIGAEPVTLHRACKHPAIEEGAIIICTVFFDQLSATSPP